MSRQRSDASPSPDPSPEPVFPPEETADPMTAVLFQEPTSSPETEWLGPAEEATSSSSPSPHDRDAGGDSPRPSTDARTLRARAKQLLPTVAAVVATAGGLAHTLLTREGTVEREAGLYLPDDEDLDAISTPLASLASRRMPEGADNPDMTDLAQLALGVVGYVVKQRAKLAQLRGQFRAEHQAEDQAAAGQPEPEYPATRIS